MRIVFMGTPDFSVPTLEVLARQGHDIIAVYSQPPRQAGRGMSVRKSPVHLKAEHYGVPVLTPGNFKERATIEQFIAHDADVAIVVAYGLLLPVEILKAPRLGCLNLHASLLPRWRGAAPINRAIMAGDKKTGVMIMQMEEGLDTGPVLIGEECPIGENHTATELHDWLMVLGGDLMGKALDKLDTGDLHPTPQAETGITYAHKLAKAETRIDWSCEAQTVHNHIRGLSTFPGAWCEMESGGKQHRLKIIKSALVEGSGQPGKVLDDALTIACGRGAIRLHTLQRSGKAAMPATDFMAGNRLSAGMMLR